MSQNLSQQQASSGGGGCLRSCLIAVAVVLVLTVGGLFATYTFGRRYVSENLPQWREQYPLLGLVGTLIDLGDAFPGQSGAPQTVGGSGRVDGETDKALLPDDLALPPEPADETYSIGDDQVTGFQRVSGTPSEVAEALQAGMADQGWELASRHQDEAGDLQIWRKGDRVCQVEVVAGDETEVWLRCRGSGTSE